MASSPEAAPQAKVATSAISVKISTSRPDASFNIKASLQQIGQQATVAKTDIVVESEIVVEGRKTLDKTGVEIAIEKYIKDHRPDPMVAIALKTHQPMVEGESITFLIDNQLQIDKLENLKRHFQNALMKSLNNGSITLTFQLFNTETSHEERKLFTASEKFEHFVNLNPVVVNLKTIFALELE